VTETTSQPLPETMLPVTQTDLEQAGFPTHAPMAPGLAVFFNDALFNRCKVLAGIMSRGEGTVPKHLIGKAEACFAIMSRAITWNLDPYGVAEGTFQTPSGQIGYKGVLIQAILENSGKLDGGVKFEHVGDWAKVKGKFKILDSQKGTGKYAVPTWTREDATGLSVIVSAKVKGESEQRTLDFDLDSAFPLHSPLWATDPKRQICYTAVRAFANLAMPGVLLGIPFDVDPTGFYGEPMENITPPRPRKAASGEFDRETKEAGTKTEPAKADTPKSNGKTNPDEHVVETIAAKDEVTVEVKRAEPAKTEPEPVTTVAEREPGDDSTAEKTAAEEHEQWYRDQVAEIEKCATIKDLIDLRDQVVQNVLNEAQGIDFRKLCGNRATTILGGEITVASTVKQVSDLRGKYTAVLGADMAVRFNKLCDERQRSILDATRKAKK
jgi:RecT family